MSSYVPKGYNYAAEITAAEAAGDAAGYTRAGTFHTTNSVTGNDEDAVFRGYGEGYTDASDYHSDVVYSGTDALSVERGYFTGYKAARDYHITATESGTDPTGTPRGYWTGFDAGYVDSTTFHRTVDTTAGETDDNGLSRGYTDGHTAGVTAGRADIERFSIRVASDQTLTKGSYTKANFDTSNDVQGVTYSSANKRITVNTTGTYEICAGGNINQSGSVSWSGIYYRFSIYKNGSAVRNGDSQAESSLEVDVMGFVRERLSLTSGDYLEIFVYIQDQGQGGTYKLDAVSPDSTDATFMGYLDI